MESAKIMPVAAAGTKLLKHADNFFNSMKAFAVFQGVALYPGTDNNSKSYAAR